MNWYYSVNNEQKGPLDQPAFDQLVQQGVITNNTLIWREGMAEWQPYGTVSTSSVAAVGASISDCAECGRSFAEGDLMLLAGRMVCAGCKPLVLQRLREGATSPDLIAEHTRKEHLNHEASIKSVGALYLLGGTVLTIAGIVMIVAASGGGIMPALIFLVLAPIQFVVGLALRKLKPWSRIVGAVLAGLGMLGFPLGTLINGYILYLLVCKKGAMVFSDEYKSIIAATPHIKYRTSIIVWIGLILAIAALVFMFVFFVSAPPAPSIPTK